MPFQKGIGRESFQNGKYNDTADKGDVWKRIFGYLDTTECDCY